MSANKSTLDITTFYLIYNSQTTYYDFLGTNRDFVANYDVSFSFDNIIDTTKPNITYRWTQLSQGGDYYGISLELTGWETIIPYQSKQTERPRYDDK